MTLRYICSVCGSPIHNDEPVSVVILPDNAEVSWDVSLHEAFTGLITHRACLPKELRS